MKPAIHSRAGSILLTVTASLTLAACGGGGSSGNAASNTPAPQLTQSVNGTVASGAAIGGASVTAIDATGKQSATVTANEQGEFVLDVTGLTAPLSLSASDPAGNNPHLVSVLTSLPPKGGSATANVTTLTTAEAAMLSDNGDPKDLQDKANLSKLTADQVQQAARTLTQILDDILAKSGVQPASGVYDPVAAPLKADGTKHDAVLDAVTLHGGDASGNGGSSSTVSLVSKHDPANAVPLNKHTGDQKPPKLAPPPPELSNQKNGLGAMKLALQACLNDAQKAGAFNKASSCAALVSNAYLDNGYTDIGKEFPALTVALSAKPGTVKAGPPQVLLAYALKNGTAIQTSGAQNPDGTFASNVQFKAAQPDHALLRLPFTLPDGTTARILSTAVKTANGWQLAGNQLAYDASVHAILRRHTFLDSASAANSRYESGLALNFNSAGPGGSAVNAVRVQGPGLPTAGLWLEPSSASGAGGFLAIAQTQPDKAPARAITTPSDTSQYRWSWTQQSGKNAPVVPAAPCYAKEPFAKPGQLPRPFALYQFTPYDSTGNALKPFAVLNVAPALLASAGARIEWAKLSADTVSGFLIPGGVLNGAQTSVPLSWQAGSRTPPITMAGIFARAGSVEVSAFQPVGGSRQAASVTVKAPGGGAFPAWAGSNAGRSVMLRLSKADELQLYDLSSYWVK